MKPSALTLWACVLTVPVLSSGSPPIAPKTPALAVNETIPPELRTLIQQQMKGHAEAMVELLLDVTLLRPDLAKQAAQRIRNRPMLARPTFGQTDTDNAQLSLRFYDLQDALRVRAAAVAEAADRGDPKVLSQRYGELASTCVECHAAFLHREHDAR